MQQLSLFEDAAFDNIVNVASVPQRSPFRYPGGKTWLVPHIKRWINSLPERPAEFIEPFAGGGIVSLNVGFDQLARHVTMVELDPLVAAVWHTIFYGDGKWLADTIATFDLTHESATQILSQTPGELQAKAFQTILKNRVNRGGILAPGAGLVKNGENGKGLKSRWYPQTLRNRILNIVSIRDKFTFIEGDGLEVLQQNASRQRLSFSLIRPIPPQISGPEAGFTLIRNWTMRSFLEFPAH
jgi:DNA adenine methylase